MLQIDKWRSETPGCEHVLHFNNAGAALQSTPVIQAVKTHIDLEATIGGYEALDFAEDKATKIYDVAAKLINAEKEEIAFLDNATHAWDMAFYSLNLKKGDRILTSVAEYASNYLAFLHKAKMLGVEIEVIRNDASGQLDIHDLKDKIDKRVKLIAITHVPTQGGLINPAEEIGKIANLAKITYILDATQSIGQMPVDVKKIGCDFLCATGRKYLRGPRGTGFLFAKKEMIKTCHPPMIDLHSAKWIANNDYQLNDDASRFETWEQNIAAKIGLGVAIDYALQIGIETIWERIQFLAKELRSQLKKISTIQLQDLGEHKCGIVTFTSKTKSPSAIQKYLTENKINVTVSLLEYARLDMSQRNLPALVRSSVHYYNTEEEIEKFCNVLKNFV